MNPVLPPHHAEHEAGALACVFDCPDPDKLFAELSLELFYDERHRSIYSETLEMSREFTISIVDLMEWVKTRNRLTACGGFEYLAALPDAKVSVGAWPSYLQSLKDFSLRRAVVRDAAAIASLSWT